MANKKNKSIESEGRMTAEGTDINSIQHKESLDVLLNRAQKRTIEEQLFVEMTSLEVKMKKYLEDSTIKKRQLYKVQDFYWEMLKTSHVSQNKLAKYIGYLPNNLGTMFKEGKVNYEIAKTLESIFHIDCTLWLDIQVKNYRIVSSKKHKKSYDDYSYEDLMG